MIVSASRRTDIPAYFYEWFFNRIRDEYVCVRNPMNVHQISKINISPQVVDCIVFWSKNPKKIMKDLNILKKYTFYFQFTITGYGIRLEPNVPPVEEVVLTFCKLSDLIGKDRLIWRYDPIVLNNHFNIKYHVNNFEKIASRLYGKTRKCVISFVDMYKKTQRNTANLKLIEIDHENMIDLAMTLSRIGSKYDLEIASCAEQLDLTEYGVKPGRCIDDKLIEEISGFGLDIDKDPAQRRECGCVASIDIGAYNTCAHECLYCYANFNHSLVHRNYAAHDPSSPLLYGTIGPTDTIHERKVLSCREIQKSLFESERQKASKRRNKLQGKKND